MVDINSILTEALKAIALGIAAVVLKVIIQYGAKIAHQAWQYIYLKAKEKDKLYVLTIASNIWNRVEEDYRIEEKITESFTSKANYFDKLLLDKFPVLTQAELDDIRQTIAGEFNRNKNTLNKNLCIESEEVINEENK